MIFSENWPSTRINPGKGLFGIMIRQHHDSGVASRFL